MSWSYYNSGKAEVVRVHAEKGLEQSEKACEQISAEARSVRAFAKALDAVCESAKGQCVRAEGSGSAWLDDGKLRSFSFAAKIEVIDMIERK